VWYDLDGSLLSASTLGQSPAGWALGPGGATLHSSIASTLFDDPATCAKLGGSSSVREGAVCRPGMVFRRVMLNNMRPPALLDT